MSRWLKVIGCLLILCSIFGFLVDYLPVDLWVYIRDLFFGEQGKTYYKIVATDVGKNYAAFTLVLGVGFIVLSKMVSAKTTK